PRGPFGAGERPSRYTRHRPWYSMMSRTDRSHDRYRETYLARLQTKSRARSARPDANKPPCSPQMATTPRPPPNIAGSLRENHSVSPPTLAGWRCSRAFSLRVSSKKAWAASNRKPANQCVPPCRRRQDQSLVSSCRSSPPLSEARAVRPKRDGTAEPDAQRRSPEDCDQCGRLSSSNLQFLSPARSDRQQRRCQSRKLCRAAKSPTESNAKYISYHD